MGNPVSAVARRRFAMMRSEVRDECGATPDGFIAAAERACADTRSSVYVALHDRPLSTGLATAAPLRIELDRGADSGGPAILGRLPLRPVTLRRHLSVGLPLSESDDDYVSGPESNKVIGITCFELREISIDMTRVRQNDRGKPCCQRVSAMSADTNAAAIRRRAHDRWLRRQIN